MARAGLDVTLVARGAHLRAMAERGVRVRSPEGDFTAHPPVTGDIEHAGPADLVVLSVKAHSLTALAPRLAPLLGPGTVVMSTQNGLPWWFTHLETIDPGGVIATAIAPDRVIGAIVYFSAEVAEPGVIRHVARGRITVGEPDGARSERLEHVAGVLRQAGLQVEITTRLREEIVVKLLGNAAFNPLSALTGATLVGMVRDPDVGVVARAIMGEILTVAAALGLELPASIDERMVGAAEQAGEHRTSMLQDMDAGRPLELDAIVGGVVELGDRLGVPMPHTRTVYACVKLRAAVRGTAVSRNAGDRD
jgi:2-dehydropantoate 2-reductase